MTPTTWILVFIGGSVVGEYVLLPRLAGRFPLNRMRGRPDDARETLLLRIFSSAVLCGIMAGMVGGGIALAVTSMFRLFLK